MSKTITEKTNLHPRNLHKFRYDFELLSQNYPKLKTFVGINEHEIETIDFSNPEAVKALNKSLLITYYKVKNWDMERLAVLDKVISFNALLFTLASKKLEVVLLVVVVLLIHVMPVNKTNPKPLSVSPFSSLSWYVIFKLPEKFEVAELK